MANASKRGGLPHGSVPFHFIADQQAREAVMKINENILALHRRLAALEAEANKKKGN